MRSRIVGLAIWASVLAIGLFGVPLGVAVLQYALQAERSELQGVADAVAIVVAGDVYDDEQIGYVSRQGAIELAVYDDDGELLGGRGPTGAGPELADALAGRVGTGTRGDRLVANGLRALFWCLAVLSASPLARASFRGVGPGAKGPRRGRRARRT